MKSVHVEFQVLDLINPYIFYIYQFICYALYRRYCFAFHLDNFNFSE